MGTGCARGFLAAFDTAWMVKSWAQGRTVLEVLAERYAHARLICVVQEHAYSRLVTQSECAAFAFKHRHVQERLVFHQIFLSLYRESIYRLLPQTTPENIGKNFDQYTIDPGTRYPNLNSACVRPHQVGGSSYFWLNLASILNT